MTTLGSSRDATYCKRKSARSRQRPRSQVHMVSSHTLHFGLAFGIAFGWAGGGGCGKLPHRWHTRLLPAATCRCMGRALPAARGYTLLGGVGGSRSSSRALARRGGGARSLTPHIHRCCASGRKAWVRIYHASRQGEEGWKAADSSLSRHRSL